MQAVTHQGKGEALLDIARSGGAEELVYLEVSQDNHAAVARVHALDGELEGAAQRGRAQAAEDQGVSRGHGVGIAKSCKARGLEAVGELVVYATRVVAGGTKGV